MYLDCTLRDGGYYTNWDFDTSLYITYLKAMEVLPVDAMEIGYRSLPMDNYLGRFFYCPVNVLKLAREHAPSKKIAVMFNEKDVRPENAAHLLLPLKEYVDIVRMAVDPNRFDSALLLAKAIKDLGFEVALNLMYMSKVVSDPEVLNKLPLMNGVVDYFSLVDSYGGVYPEDVKATVEKVLQLVTMPVGFHGHNNLEMAFINSITAVEAGATWIDGTVTGMGRGAGNLKTELFLVWAASRKKENIDFDALSQVVDVFEVLKKEHEWGTNLPYMISGASSLPQKDVMDWVTKRYYSLNSIVRALQNQKTGKKDNVTLEHFSEEKKYTAALIVGGGPGAVAHADALHDFINTTKDIVVIHASSKNALSFEKVSSEQIFCLVGNEGHRMEEVFGHKQKIKGKCVLPPFPRKMGTYIPASLRTSAYELNDVTFTDKYEDSHTALALQTAIELGVSVIYVTGYDGYEGQSIGKKEQELFMENEYLFRKMKEAGHALYSITPTTYKELEPRSVYASVS